MSALVASLLDVDNHARLLMRHAGTRRQKEELRDALQELRAHVLELVAARAADGEELDVETFKAIVRHAARSGRWQEFAIAFNQVGREVAT